MKKFLLFIVLITITISAQRPFIAKFDASNKIIIIETDGRYSYTYQKVGSTDIYGPYYASNPSTTINVLEPGLYIVSVYPIGTFRFTGSSNILDIMQWGDITWNSNLSGMFYNRSNLQISATDIPDFSNVTNMSQLFRNCKILANIPNINSWNVSQVTDMGQMFSGATLFNSNISAWNTSNVTNMYRMFYLLPYFNQNIGNWDVSNVLDMEGMFYGATSFNQPIGNWNVQNVKTMFMMFQNATSFNQPLQNWNVSKVTKMTNMFSFCNFNQPIGTWDVSGATALDGMFQSNSSFNQNIGAWNVSNALYLSSMFKNATSFNQNLGSWNLNGSSSNLALNIFDNSGLSCENYALTLKGWAENPSTPSNRSLGALSIKYGTNGKAYRNLLSTQKGWTFKGDIYEPTCQDALATQENSFAEKLNIYPNPTTGKFFYESKAEEVLQISNSTGQLLKTIKVAKGNNQVDISEFAKGVYFIKAGNKSSKLIKN